MSGASVNVDRAPATDDLRRLMGAAAIRLPTVLAGVRASPGLPG